MKKIIELAFLLLTLGSLCFLAVYTVCSEKETYSYYENRDLQELPGLNYDALHTGTYLTRMESYLSDHAAGREKLTRLDTAINISLLHRPVVNETVIGDDILLPFLDYQTVSRDEIYHEAEKEAETLNTINNAVTGYGGVYCYVAVPGQYTYFSDRYPRYLSSHAQLTDLTVSALRDALNARSIPFLDLGEAYQAAGNPDSFFSTVDHHYTAYGAFFAYQQILSYLNTTQGGSFPILQEDDISFTPVDWHHLGSRARKIFDLTDLEVPLYAMIPREPVSFVRTDNGYASTSSVYSLPEDPDAPLTYSFYMGGDVAHTEIYTYRSQLPTVLIYGDSYTNALESILYLSCDTMYSIDLRYYTDGTLTEFIQQTQPDYVICLRDYSVLLSGAGNGGE